MNPEVTSDKEQDMNTLELAKLYENQGYYQDAHKIYSGLAAEQPPHIPIEEIEAGLQRTQNEFSKTETQVKDPSKDKIASLLEQWLKLMVVKQRLENFKRIKARLS